MWLWNFLNVPLKESLLIPFAPWLEPRWSSWTTDSTLSNQDSKIGGECSWGLPQDNRSLHFVLVAQSCLTLCNLTDCSPPGSSVYGIVQARILEWVTTFSFSGGSSQPRDQTWVSCTGGGFFTVWVTRTDSKSTSGLYGRLKTTTTIKRYLCCSYFLNVIVAAPYSNNKYHYKR